MPLWQERDDCGFRNHVGCGAEHSLVKNRALGTDLLMEIRLMARPCCVSRKKMKRQPIKGTTFKAHVFNGQYECLFGGASQVMPYDPFDGNHQTSVIGELVIWWAQVLTSQNPDTVKALKKKRVSFSKFPIRRKFIVSDFVAWSTLRSKARNVIPSRSIDAAAAGPIVSTRQTLIKPALPHRDPL